MTNPHPNDAGEVTEADRRCWDVAKATFDSYPTSMLWDEAATRVIAAYRRTVTASRDAEIAKLRAEVDHNMELLQGTMNVLEGIEGSENVEPQCPTWATALSARKQLASHSATIADLTAKLEAAEGELLEKDKAITFLDDLLAAVEWHRINALSLAEVRKELNEAGYSDERIDANIARCRETVQKAITEAAARKASEAEDEGREH